MRLGDVAEINPRRDRFHRHADAQTSFVPMEAVHEATGTASPRPRPYSAVAKGYTFFREGDVLFAKITPCMQNGKAAIATGLIDGVGFGTTEFHVIRPGERVTAEWIHLHLRNAETLDAAEQAMTGAVGQQRVPPEWLRELELPLPPLDEQGRIVAALAERRTAVETLRARAESLLADQRKLASEWFSQWADEQFARHGSVRLGAALSDAEAFRDGPFGSMLKTAHYRATGARVIRLGNLGEGEFLDHDQAYVSLDHFEQIKRHEACRGDVIVASLGDGARAAGRAVALPELPTPAVVKADCFRIRPGARFSAEYLALAINSPAVRAQVTSQLRGATRPRVTLEMLRSLQVPDAPPEAQSKAVAQVVGLKGAGAALATAISAQLADLAALDAAVLRGAFSGAL